MINTVLTMSPIAAGTMLGICVIPVVALGMQSTCVLCCGVRCCMLCYILHSYCNPYTPLHPTGCTPVNKTATKYTKLFPHPWGPGCTPGHKQSITYRTFGGLATCEGMPSACLYPILVEWMLQNYCPRHHMQGAQHININSNINTIVTHGYTCTVSRSLQIHQPAPLRGSIHHVQGYSLAI